MQRAQKPSNQRRQKIHDDFSRNGMEIVKPEHATERNVRKYISTVVLQARVYFNSEMRETILPILRSGQSIRLKIERIKAAVMEKNLEEFHSPRHMNLLGIRMVECQCSPGMGHKSRPKRQRK